MRSTLSIGTSLLCLLWCFIFSWFFFKDWCPLSIHPLSLFFRQLPFWAGDFSAAFIKILLDGTAPLIWLSICTLASAGLGSLALIPLKKLFNPFQHLLFSIAAGLILLGYYTFAAGLLGLYCTAGLFISWCVVGASALTGALFIYRLARGRITRRTIALRHIPVLIIIVLAGCFLFAKALFPVTHIDAVVYHLGVPNYYLQEGGITYIPYDAFSNFPFMAEMLYTLAMFLSGVKSAQVLCVFVFFLLLASVYMFAKRFLNEIPAWLPVLFCLAVPSFFLAALLVKNDLHFTLYVLLAVYCFFEWQETENRGWLILTGCCIGACATIKYTAMLFLPAPAIAGVCYGVLKTHNGSLRQLPGALTAAALPALIVFSPWLIRNLLWTGNPLYPGLYGFFGGRDMSTSMAATITMLSLPPNGFSDILRGLWEHPLTLAMGRQEAFDRYGMQWNMGPLFLLFVPVLAVIKNISPVIKKLLLLSLALFLIWNATFIISRFLYPAMVFITIVAAYAAAIVVKRCVPSVKPFVAGLCCLYSALMLGIGFHTVNMHTMQYGRDGVYYSDATYLGKHTIDNPQALFDGLSAYRYINENTLPTSRTLLIGDVQHLYIQRRHAYTYLSATTPYQIFKDQSTQPDHIYRSLKAQGFTHLYYNPTELRRLQDVGVIAYPAHDNRYIEQFLQSGFVTLRYSNTRTIAPGFVYELR